MKKVPVSKIARIIYGAFFVFGLAVLGFGVTSYSPGADAGNVLALLFIVSGAYLALETIGRMLGWEK